MAIPELETLNKSIEDLVDAKITDRFANHPIQVDVAAVSFSQFEEAYMVMFDGYEHIDHSFFRRFLRWMERYYAYHLEQDAEVIRAGIQVSHIVTGIYAAPDLTEYEGLKPILDELFGRIANIDIVTLTGRVSTVEQDILTLQNDVSPLASAISTLSGNLSSHIGNTALHLIPDEIGILTNASKLSLSDSYIKGLFSASSPIVYSNGAFSLKIDAATLQVNLSGELEVIGGGGGGSAYGLSFNSETNVLSIVENGGTATVDLSSLKAGGVDLSNYVKKTGEPTQTIQGNIIVTGTITAGGEIAAFGS